ncbi:MAG: NUDIX hydrolase [Defluviitaleaceae bacterium]|nr:NUDIX hydrolase [Defluviitaleaceae bacterium]
MHKVNQTKTVFEGKVFTAKVENVELPNGKSVDREVVIHSGGASMVAIIKDSIEDKIVLVKQYRHALGDFSIEIPAGLIEKNEDPKITATRELREETGYISENTIHLITMYKSLGYSTEKHYIYFCENPRQGTQNLDEDEDVEVILKPINEALQMIYSGAIVDSKAICGILAYIQLSNKQ